MKDAKITCVKLPPETPFNTNPMELVITPVVPPTAELAAPALLDVTATEEIDAVDVTDAAVLLTAELELAALLVELLEPAGDALQENRIKSIIAILVKRVPRNIFLLDIIAPP